MAYQQKFTDRELDGLREARKANPNVPQRKLARIVYNNIHAFNVNVGRSSYSIYSAVRRVEKALKAAVTQGVQAANSKADEYANA